MSAFASDAVKEDTPANPDLPQLTTFPELQPGVLFVMADEKDKIAHDKISEMIEDVLATAPRRTDQVHKVLHGISLRHEIVEIPQDPLHPHPPPLPPKHPYLPPFSVPPM